jgi:hypothetical protein
MDELHDPSILLKEHTIMHGMTKVVYLDNQRMIEGLR